MAWSDTNEAYNPHHTDNLKAPDTPKRPMAVMSIIITLLLFAGIFVALFFGGRWVYNSFISDSNESTTSESTTEQPKEAESDQSQQPSTPSDNSGSTTQNSTTTPSSPDSGSTSDQSASSTPSGSSPSTSDTSSSTDNEQSKSDVPNTGPGSVLGIFVVSALIGTITYQIVTRKQ